LERAVAVKEGGAGWPDAEMEAAFERYLESVSRVLAWVDQRVKGPDPRAEGESQGLTAKSEA
jgi:hypothetical protein